MLSWLADPNVWIGLVTLTALELVLGIDNVIFIAILAGRLPKQDQAKARRLGLTGALITRIGFLLAITWIMGLTGTLFAAIGHEFSGRDVILIVGGLFLIGKATFEIHSKLEGVEQHHEAKMYAALWAVVAQIMVVDIVFSIDSVITAVGMVQSLGIMIAGGRFDPVIPGNTTVPVRISNVAFVESVTLDLNTDADYSDHKDNLKDLADFSLLGRITNNTANPVDVEFWITKTPSHLTTVPALNSDPTAVKIWGPLSLAANESKQIDWDASAGLFTAAGRAALQDEVRNQNGGDATFTLYAVGAEGTFDFTIQGGVLVLVLDAGL